MEFARDLEARTLVERELEELRSEHLRRATLWILPLVLIAVLLAIALDLRAHGRIVSPVDAVGLPLLAGLFALGYLVILRHPDHTVTVARSLFLAYLGYLLVSFAYQHFEYYARHGRYSEVGYWAYPAYVSAFLLYPRKLALLIAGGIWGLFLLTSLAYAWSYQTPVVNQWVQFHSAGLVTLGVASLLSLSHVWLAYAQRLARTDGLTGLPNRRAMQFLLEQAVYRARREGRPLSIILFDLDDFKQINDRWGHWSGDRVLKELAEALQRHFRKGDPLGRWGGEEFLVVLEGKDEQDALALADRLCQQIKTLSPEGISLSASFGVATLRPGEDAESLVARADRAMYRAKARGKGRVERAD